MKRIEFFRLAYGRANIYSDLLRLDKRSKRSVEERCPPLSCCLKQRMWKKWTWTIITCLIHCAASNGLLDITNFPAPSASISKLRDDYIYSNWAQASQCYPKWSPKSNNESARTEWGPWKSDIVLGEQKNPMWLGRLRNYSTNWERAILRCPMGEYSDCGQHAVSW